MNQNELKNRLSSLGFQHFTPACATWSAAFVYQFDTQVLVVLVRKRGVDLRYYARFNDQIFLDKNNKLSLNEGVIVRSTYGEAKFNIHNLVLEAATNFTIEKVDTNLFPHSPQAQAQACA
jgi:hypothetical protein